MALPKGKISKSRGRMRRANWKLSAPGIVKCPRCQQMKLAHRICCLLYTSDAADESLPV